MRRVLRGLAIAFLGALGTVLTAVFGWVVVVLGPYLLDDYRLDGVVRVAAADWRDFGREGAIERLQFELDRSGIDEAHVGDHHCAFDEVESLKVVQCVWTATVRIPGTDRTLPLRFESRASFQE